MNELGFLYGFITGAFAIGLGVNHLWRIKWIARKKQMKTYIGLRNLYEELLKLAKGGDA